jgi:hypothetical protein
MSKHIIDKKIYVQGFLHDILFKNGLLYSHTKCLCGEMATVNTIGTLTFCSSCKTLRETHWDGKGLTIKPEPLSYEVTR